MSSKLLRIAVLLLLAILASCERKVPTATDSNLKPADVPVPANLAATVGDGQVLLSWTLSSADSARITVFLVYRIDSLDAEPRRIDSIAWPPYTDASAINGTQYAYTVSARSTDGVEGARSSIITAQPRFVSLRVNDDSIYTRSIDVRLNLTATGATLMRLANDTTQPASWRTFQSNVPWQLISNAGPKSVFAQFQFVDGADYLGWVEDSIVLDDRASIASVVVSDSVLAPGDSLFLYLDAGETSGTATYDLGSQRGTRLFDDGNPPDAVTDDGMYTALYVATDGQLFEGSNVTGHFVDRAGNSAPAVQAAWRVSVRKAPPAPVWVSILTIPSEPRQLQLTWASIDAQPFSQLLLRRSLTPSQGTAAPIIKIFGSSGVTSYTDTGLVGSSTYYYTLEVALTNGLLALSAENTGTTAIDLAPDPVTVAVEPTADSSLALSWTPATASDFESYRVYRAVTLPELNPIPPDDSLLVSIIPGRSTTSYSEAGLTQFFYYRVFVFDQAGQSAGSNTVWGPREFGP
jgi:hypothetical protein